MEIGAMLDELREKALKQTFLAVSSTYFAL